MLTKLSDKIYYLPNNPDTDRPALGYVKGSKYALMIDAGNSLKHVQLFMQQLAHCNLAEPDFVGITHWHWDHTYGLASIHVPSIACNLTNIELVKMGAWHWDDAAMQERLQDGSDIEFCTEMIAKEYLDRNDICIQPADIIFDEQLVLDLGGITCEIKRVAGPHSEDSTIYYIPEEKIVFLGDCAYEDLYNGNIYYKQKLKDLMDYLLTLDFERYIQGHSMHQTKKELQQDLESELAKN
jgi:glyoxylase-like metal-dependent hydrolase (beta-lactamase superfamily II)